MVDASDLQDQATRLSFEDGVNQCINQVSTAPRVQAYRTLCSTVETLYEQQRLSANTIHELQVANAQMQVQAGRLRDRDLAVQAQAQAASAQIQTEEQQLLASSNEIRKRALALERLQMEDRRKAATQQKRQELRTSLLERALRAARQTERQQVFAFHRKERELDNVIHQQAEGEIAGQEARIRDWIAKTKHGISAKLEAPWELHWAQKLAALESENAALRKEMENMKNNNDTKLLEQLRALQKENAQLVNQCG